MASRVKHESCCEQVEKRNITSRPSFFGIVKNVFGLNHSRSAGQSLSYNIVGTSKTSEVIAIQARVQAAEAQFRRMQMLR